MVCLFWIFGKIFGGSLNLQVGSYGVRISKELLSKFVLVAYELSKAKRNEPNGTVCAIIQQSEYSE
jgi:hypothetical protein